jgi:hypothetical protein
LLDLLVETLQRAFEGLVPVNRYVRHPLSPLSSQWWPPATPEPTLFVARLIIALWNELSNSAAHHVSSASSVGACHSSHASRCDSEQAGEDLRQEAPRRHGPSPTHRMERARCCINLTPRFRQLGRSWDYAGAHL